MSGESLRLSIVGTALCVCCVLRTIGAFILVLGVNVYYSYMNVYYSYVNVYYGYRTHRHSLRLMAEDCEGSVLILSLLYLEA